MMQLLKITLISGLRSRAIWLAAILALLCFAAAFLAGGFSARQPAIISTDVGISATRFALLLLTLIWSQEQIQKDLDRKTIHWILAYPIDRSSYLAGKVIGIAVLLFFATIIMALPLLTLGKFSTWGYSEASSPVLGIDFIIMVIGLWLESLVILTFTTLMITISTTPYLAIILGLLFSLASKGLGATLDFLLFSPYAEESFKQKFSPIANTLRWFLPDLSSLDWRQPVLYGNWDGLHPEAAALMAVCYSIVLCSCAMLIFRKRGLH